MTDAHSNRNISIKLVLVFFTIILLAGLFPALAGAAVINPDEKPAINTYFLLENPYDTDRSGTTYNKNGFVSNPIIPLRKVEAAPFSIKALAAEYGHAGMFSAEFVDATESVSAAHVLIQAIMDYHAARGTTIDPFDPAYIGWNTDGTITSVMGVTIAAESRPSPALNFDAMKVQVIPEGITPPDNWISGSASNIASVGNIAANSVVKLTRIAPTVANPDKERIFASSAAEITQTIDEPLKIYTRTIMWSTLSGSYALKTSYGTAVYTAKIYCYNPFNQTYTDVTSDPSFIAATHGEPNITTGNGSYYEITFAANGQYIVALQLTNTSTYYSMTSYTMVNFSGKAASVDLTALESAIANAQSKTPDNYYPANDRWNGTDTSANGFYADMQTALAAAQLALNSPDQQAIDNAAAALNTAAGKLIPKTKVNATVLHEALQANIDPSSYTNESAANYSAARDAAQTLYAGGAVAQTVYSEGAQADIEDKAAALNAAAADLLTNTEVEAAEKVRANLNALLALVAGFDQSDYTPASWTLLTSAKAEAEAVKDIAVTTKAQAAAVTLPYNNLWDVYLHKLVDADGVVHVSLRVEGAAGRYGTLYLNDSMSVSVKSAEDMRTKYYDTDNLTPSATPNVMHLIAAMWDETGIPTPYYGSNKPITFKQTDGFIGKLFDSSGAEALIGYRSHIYINGVLIDPSVSDTELYAALHEGDAVVLASYPVQDENGIYNQQRYYARFTGDAITDGAVTVATGEAFSLTAEAKDGFDLSGSYAPIKGLQIFVSEAGALGATKATGIKTGNNGSFSYTFTQPGDYVVEAYLSDQTAKASTVPARVVVHVTGTDYGEITTVIDPIVNNIASYFTTTWTMGAGTLGGDWTNIGMQVYGRPLLTSEAELNEFAVLSVAQLRTNVVWTDYARIGLALSSLGFDVSDLDQYNLDFKDHSGNPVHSLIDGLVNFDNDYTLNGPVYALLLLDSKDYEIPAGAKWTRDALVEAVLEYRGANGAFSLTNRLNGKGSANDTDLTAMALQALAPYRSRADVAAAAGKAVTWLSSVQWESGGFQASQYTGTAGVTSESTAQVIMALCALGIDPAADARFIKSGQEAPFGTFAPHSAIAGLLDFITPDGAGFAHSRDTQNLYGDQRDKNEFNSMSTDQGFLALLAYQNFVRNGGQPTCVYDFGALSAQTVDKTQLARMLTIAGQLENEGYTAASWTAFTQALNRAAAVNDNAAARQKQVDAAWIELTNALASLTPRLTNAQLSAIIAVLETETSFPAGDYDDRDLDGGIGFGTYYNYLTALDAAKTVAASENASEAEINAALDGIETAINGLRVWPSDTDISVMGMLAPGADRYFDGDHIYEFFSDTGMEGQGISGAGSAGVYGLLHPDPSTVYSKEVNVITTITAYKNGTRGLVFKDDAEALAVLTDTTQTTGAYYFSLTQMIARAESLGADTRYTQATREALAAAATQAGEILGAYLAGQSAPGDGDEETTPGDGDEETTPGDGDEETTPGDGDEESAPGDGDEESAPGDGDEESAPGDGDEETTPGDGETALGAAQIAAADTEPLDAEETTPSAAQVAAAGTELLYALNNLEYDKTDLQVLISEAQAKSVNSYEYGGWLVLQDRIKTAEMVANCYDADILQLDEMSGLLNTALDGLVAIPAGQSVKTILNTLLASVSDLEQASYTEESWTAFTLALNKAQAVAGKANAVNDEYLAAINALNNAVYTLVNQVIPVTKVTLPAKVTVQVGASTTLSATVAPANATDKTLAWSSSDDKVATVDENGKVTGQKAGTATITAQAQDGSGKSAACTVSVVPVGETPGETQTITVTFKLLGTPKDGPKGTVNTLADGNLTTWIEKTSVTVPKDALVYDVFTKVLDDNGMFYDDTRYNHNYISGIEAPASLGGYSLYEFDNGYLSGWMYTVNGKHPNLGLSEYTLKDGDNIVWHYTDDYTREEGSDKWNTDTTGTTTGDQAVPGAQTGPLTQSNQEALAVLNQVTDAQQAGAALPETAPRLNPAALTETVLTTADGVKLSVPPGALNNQSDPLKVIVRIGAITTPPQADSGARVLDPLKYQRQFELETPAGLVAEGTANFTAPVTLSFPIVSSDLPAGVTTGQLAVYWWNPEKQDWFKLGGVFDPLTQTLSLPVYHFSTYAVMADTAGVPQRLAGADRFLTANAIAAQGWKAGADNVVLVNAFTFADALAAAPLAFKLNAPILLTERDTLTLSTQEELQKLGAKKITLIGGTGVISQAIQDSLSATYGPETVIRYGGSDRYETAALIAAALGTTGRAVLANGEDGHYLDALAVSAYAAYQGIPILFTESQALPAATGQALTAQKVSSTIVVGGEAVVAPLVYNQLPGAERYAGANRYATATAIAEGLKFNPNRIYLATGLNFADALTAGNLAAHTLSPLIMVDQTVPQASADYLTKQQGTISELVIVGGEGIISTEQESAVRALVNP